MAGLLSQRQLRGSRVAWQQMVRQGQARLRGREKEAAARARELGQEKTRLEESLALMQLQRDNLKEILEKSRQEGEKDSASRLELERELAQAQEGAGLGVIKEKGGLLMEDLSRITGQE
jgi:hypothetical protein